MRNAQIHTVFLRILNEVDHKNLKNNQLYTYYELLIQFL